jgi:hypothetical protein
MTTPASVPHTAEADQDELHRFRNECYDCLTARADGLFELLDGVLAENVIHPGQAIPGH